MMPDDPCSPDDTDRLVELIAAGGRTHAEIAEELHLPVTYVTGVARGQIRPELYGRIQAAVAGYIDEAWRLGAKWSKALMSRHIRIAMDPDGGELARKCREYLLNVFVKPSAGKETAAAPAPRPGKRLTLDEMAHWAEANDGPEP